MKAAHKNECPGGAGQVAKTIKSIAIDFIAICTWCASASDGVAVLGFILLVQVVLLSWGLL